MTPTTSLLSPKRLREITRTILIAQGEKPDRFTPTWRTNAKLHQKLERVVIQTLAGIIRGNLQRGLLEKRTTKQLWFQPHEIHIEFVPDRKRKQYLQEWQNQYQR